MRKSLALLVGCALVLGGAYFASKTLVSEVPTPAPVGVATVVSPPPDVNTPAVLAPAQRYDPDREAQQAALRAPRQGPLQPVNAYPTPGDPRLAEANAPPPVADVTPSPYQGESKELDYAELLLTEPSSDPERLLSAYEVLSRCAEQEPNNQRCQEGLALAKSRLSPPAAKVLKPVGHALETEPPHLLRPASQSK